MHHNLSSFQAERGRHEAAVRKACQSLRTSVDENVAENVMSTDFGVQMEDTTPKAAPEVKKTQTISESAQKLRDTLERVKGLKLLDSIDSNVSISGAAPDLVGISHSDKPAASKVAISHSDKPAAPNSYAGVTGPENLPENGASVCGVIIKKAKARSPLIIQSPSQLPIATLPSRAIRRKGSHPRGHNGNLPMKCYATLN